MGTNICGNCGAGYSRTYTDRCPKCKSHLRLLAGLNGKQVIWDPVTGQEWPAAFHTNSKGESIPHRTFRRPNVGDDADEWGDADPRAPGGIGYDGAPGPGPGE